MRDIPARNMLSLSRPVLNLAGYCCPPDSHVDIRRRKRTGEGQMLKWIIAAVMAATMVAMPSVSNAQVTIDEYVKQACVVNQQACDDGRELARKIMPCLQLPTGEPSHYKMLARVMLEDGTATFASIGFDSAQPSSWEQQAAAAAQDAIASCEPYAELSGPLVFLITPSLLRSEWR
ncbi:hypothetical protein [Devosia salina]|uniref:Cell envelope integrity protein TolA n=1 Tax=Devosia salina TaxID=2860336 RepID=A0ABX8W892_9HYPH|nr:hypothetical protein [Devosia salina]QYO75175.1 hypothetical protein K1X15_10925 [Devosia salina]